MIDIKDVEAAIQLTQEIKELEARKKVHVENIKKEMIATGQDVINHNGSKIQLVRSKRFTVKKDMKDKLLSFLKTKNLNSCIAITADVNKEVLETEINTGRVTTDELNTYMSISNVDSIRVTV